MAGSFPVIFISSALVKNHNTLAWQKTCSLFDKLIYLYIFISIAESAKHIYNIKNKSQPKIFFHLGVFYGK